MENWRRLPGSRTEPAGFERKCWRACLMVALVGTAVRIGGVPPARLHW